MDKDLFGNKIIKKKTRKEISLEKYDKKTFEERLKRLQSLDKIFPKYYSIAGDMQTIFVFDEAKMTFINGEFISTILLAQAFIEKILQSHYIDMGLNKIASRGLKAIVNHAKRNNIINEYLLIKIEELRKKRNPFVHLKPLDYEYNLDKRFMTNIINSDKHRDISDVMEQDAKEALSLMYTIFITDLRKIGND